ncbi:hypothetical protein MKZ38_009844 [Zalerion maritima]|uniref:Uncharacterized protein n=1 Tax=Zalerion maritima TaxID=339359 RepID=A0AAD5WXF5_9PEZI|nr:hypothetical protein MKZ38_009844 [Zalerion maritima]
MQETSMDLLPTALRNAEQSTRDDPGDPASPVGNESRREDESGSSETGEKLRLGANENSELDPGSDKPEKIQNQELVKLVEFLKTIADFLVDQPGLELPNNAWDEVGGIRARGVPLQGIIISLFQYLNRQFPEFRKPRTVRATWSVSTALREFPGIAILGQPTDICRIITFLLRAHRYHFTQQEVLGEPRLLSLVPGVDSRCKILLAVMINKYYRRLQRAGLLQEWAVVIPVAVKPEEEANGGNDDGFTQDRQDGKMAPIRAFIIFIAFELSISHQFSNKVGFNDMDLAMGFTDTPPAHVPAWVVPASTVTLGIGFALWSLTYILITRRSIATKSHGMPLLALATNVSWEMVYLFYVVESIPEMIGFAFWLVLDVGLVYGALQFSHFEFDRARTPWIGRHIAILFASLTAVGLWGNLAFVSWWLEEPGRGFGGIEGKHGKWWRGADCFDTTEMAYWSAAVAQLIASAGCLAMLVERQHTGGASYAICPNTMVVDVGTAHASYPCPITLLAKEISPDAGPEIP